MSDGRIEESERSQEGIVKETERAEEKTVGGAERAEEVRRKTVEKNEEGVEKKVEKKKRGPGRPRKKKPVVPDRSVAEKWVDEIGMKLLARGHSTRNVLLNAIKASNKTRVDGIKIFNKVRGTLREKLLAIFD